MKENTPSIESRYVLTTRAGTGLNPVLRPKKKQPQESWRKARTMHRKLNLPARERESHRDGKVLHEMRIQFDFALEPSFKRG
jgi:hypothetical protein